jgi:hypothetical protein
MSIVVWAWVLGFLAVCLTMRFITNEVWLLWIVGGDLVFLALVYFLAFRFWRVRVHYEATPNLALNTNARPDTPRAG